MARLHSEHERERGSATVELILLTPVFIAFLLLVVGTGRLVDAKLQVDQAVHAAARAASLALTPSAADNAANAAAAQSLSGAGITCSPMNLSTDVGSLAPGGTARVTLSCTVSLSDVSGLGAFPGHRTITASFSSVVDTYRSTPTQP
ncbi:TadE/TadG family type IV pilus assembly protein [Catenulispora rubra]|uniref:TadE/TadG family type IV pilus assembly protein n=1 Tax=Catenulispora rubra TaxID=280293 RepID=UPI00189215FA|nr:TadE family protein [Catenulispora rubra]